MPNEEVTIDGLAEVAKQLEGLPSRVAKSVVRPALSAGGQVFESAIQTTVPRGATGALARSISRKVSIRGSGIDRAIVLSGPKYVGGYKHTSQDPGVRAAFLEKGTRKMAGRHFMKRAFDMSKSAALSAAVSVLKAICGEIPK